MFNKIFRKKEEKEPFRVKIDPFTLSNHTFSLEFYKSMDTNDQNIFFSPFGISLAFALLYQGSGGRTKNELEQIFSFEGDSIITYLDFIAMLMRNEKLTQNELDINTLFVSFIKGGFSGEIQDIAQCSEQLQLLMESSGDPVGTSQKIDQLISKYSRGKYQSMLPITDREDPDGLYIATIIYFMGKWLNPFEEKVTHQRFFLPSSGLSDVAAMMYIERHLRYYEESDLQMLELPYKGSKLSMLILLPSQQNGISWLEQQLVPASIATWLSGLEDRMVKVYLPKFDMENSLDLVGSLKTLGMVDSFDRKNANFRRLTQEGQQAYVNRALQRSRIEVNESGTKAAALTELDIPMFVRAGKPKKPVLFMADHPFLFLIIQRSTKMILFMGKVEKP
jgi:serpin B